jgi:predicted nuclease of predicted toxin-antitoxin system
VNGFLLDENLPGRLGFPMPLPVIHSTELGNSPSDTDIWNYARTNSLVIISKDADFSNRMAAAQPPPWVIHLRFGNMNRRDFNAFLEEQWPTIFEFLPSHKQVNVYSDRVEAIS